MRPHCLALDAGVDVQAGLELGSHLLNRPAMQTFGNANTHPSQHQPDMTRSGTADSLIDAYRTDGASDTASSPLDRSRSHSPVQTRPHMPTKSSSARDTNADGRKRKPHVPLDVIDKLDVSGLYGGGALARHDGPFAAAAASRQKGSRAPMAAFDSASLAPPPTLAFAGPARTSSRSVSASAATPSQNLSPRAVAALAAMHGHDLAHNASLAEGPYAAAGSGQPPHGRRNSDSSLNTGTYPVKQGDGKGAQLIEMYGVRDSEAWEDFGRERDRVNGQVSRESVVPSVTSKKSERSAKAQSIWDIEATLAAGKPVAQQAPPVPIVPDDQYFVNGSPADNRPKRSKSLAARLRPNRKPSQSHVAADMNDSDTQASPTPLRDANGRYDDPSPQQRQRSATLTNSNQQPPTDEFEHLSIDSPSRLKVTSPASPIDRFKEQEGGGYFGDRSGGADVQRRPTRKRLHKNLSVTVPDPAPFLAAATAASLVQQHPTSEPSAQPLTTDVSDDDSDSDDQERGYQDCGDWTAHSGATPVTLPLVQAGSSAAGSRPRPDARPVRGTQAAQRADMHASGGNWDRDAFAEVNGGFGGVHSEQDAGLGLGLGQAGEQVAREMRLQSIESLRTGSVSPRTTARPLSLSKTTPGAMGKHVEMVLPPPQPANVANPAWDRSSASSSDSANSSPPMPGASLDSSATTWSQARPSLPAAAGSQTSIECAQAQDTGTFVSVASGPLAQLASAAQPRTSRARGARALISNLLSRSPRSHSGGSPRLGEQHSSTLQPATASPSNRRSDWASVGTGNDSEATHLTSLRSSGAGCLGSTASSVTTLRCQSGVEAIRGGSRQIPLTAEPSSSRTASAMLSDPSSSTPNRRVASATSSPRLSGNAGSRVPDTPATVGMSTPIVETTSEEPEPTLLSLGLSVGALTQSLSLSKTGMPLCGAILDGKYLLIGTTQSLDFLPLPAPGAMSATNDKQQRTRKPISLIKKTRFKELAVLSERSNILLAIAGRNDHVRVYALDSVRALIRRKLAETSRQAGYPIMQASHLRPPAKSKSSKPSATERVRDRLEDLAPLPSPPPQYDSIAHQRPTVRRQSSRPSSWHQSSSSAFYPPPPSPSRPVMARGSSGTIVDSVPRNPRGSIGNQGSVGSSTSNGVRHVRGQKSREFVASRRGSTATVASRRRSRVDVHGSHSPGSLSRRSSCASVEHGRRQSSTGFTLTPGTPSFESQKLSVAPASLIRQTSETASDSGWITSNGASPCPPFNDYFSQPVSPRTLVPPSLTGSQVAATGSVAVQTAGIASTSSSDALSALPFPSRPRSARSMPRHRPQSVVPRSSSDFLPPSARLLPRKPTTLASPATDQGTEGSPERETLSLADIIRDGLPLPSSLPASSSAPLLRLNEASASVEASSTASSSQLRVTPDGSPTNRQMKRWTVGGVGSRLLNRSASHLGDPRAVSSGQRAASLEENRPALAPRPVNTGLHMPSSNALPEFKRRHSELNTDDGETTEPYIDGLNVEAHLAAATSAIEYVKLARTKGAFSFKAVETKKKTYLAVLCGEEGERVELFTGSRSVSLALNRTFVLPEAPRSIEFQLQGDDLVDIYLLYSESIFAIEPSTVRVREVGVGRAERRARRERERRLQQASAAAVTAFAEGGLVSSNDAFLHPADPAREDIAGTTLPVTSSAAIRNEEEVEGALPTSLDTARSAFSRTPSLNRPLPATPALSSAATPALTSDVPSEARTRSSKSSLPYTTFQQLPFVPPVPSSVLSSAWTIPPLYTDVVTSSPDPGSSRATAVQPPLLSPVSLLSGAAPRGDGRPGLFFVSKGDSLSGIVTAEGKSVIKRPMVWTSSNALSVGEQSAVDAPRRLEMLVSGGTKTFIISISANEVKAIAVQGGLNEPSFTAAARALKSPADAVQWLGTHAQSSQLFFAERNGQHIVFKCLTVVN
ncbi:hypothetical protein OIV83_000507 [Microbotryomycetes sp. JL201]|nr:hypothetical protein OIV83_000507 [Microbotryomycetes sp. JL201]